MYTGCRRFDNRFIKTTIAEEDELAGIMHLLGHDSVSDVLTEALSIGMAQIRARADDSFVPVQTRWGRRTVPIVALDAMREAWDGHRLIPAIKALRVKVCECGYGPEVGLREAKDIAEREFKRGRYAEAETK